MQLARQWERDPQGHLLRLNLSAFIPVIHAKGWDVSLAIELLSIIEDVYLCQLDETTPA